MKPIEGDSARLGAHVRGLGVWETLASTQAVRGVDPRAAEPPTTAIKEGTGSGGKLQRRAVVRTQQAVATVDKCHAAEQDTPAEAT